MDGRGDHLLREMQMFEQEVNNLGREMNPISPAPVQMGQFGRPLQCPAGPVPGGFRNPSVFLPPQLKVRPMLPQPAAFQGMVPPRSMFPGPSGPIQYQPKPAGPFFGQKTPVVTISAPKVSYNVNQPSLPENLPAKSEAVPPPKPVEKQSVPKASSSKPTGSMLSNADEKKKPKKFLRMAAGTVWEDPKLLEFDPKDFRIFCGDLGNDVTDDMLNKIFNRYPSFQKARVVRDKKTNKTKGYGFASFKDPGDFMKAMRELNGKYVGCRPIKLKKSCWQDRNVENVKKKEKERKKMGFK